MKRIVVSPHETADYLELFKILKFQNGLIKAVRPIGYIENKDIPHVPLGYVTSAVPAPKANNDITLNVYDKNDLESL